MKRTTAFFVVLILIVLTGPQPATAQQGPQPAERDPKEEQVIYDRLSTISSEAVPYFREATRAMDAGDLESARRGYETVLTLAPGFVDALRRLSYVEIESGDIQAALAHARQAVEVEASPWNQYALASALLASDTPAARTEALGLAQAAAEALPDEPSTQLVLIQAAFANEKPELGREASDKLLRVAPELPISHYLAGLVSAIDGHWETAEAELLRAQDLGMPAEAVQDVLDQGIRTQARFRRGLRGGAYATAAWLAGLGLLLLLGLALSKGTLVLVARAQQTGETGVGRGERLLRGIYRSVIAVTSAYFYVSIPFLILVVVALVVGIIYLFLALGHVPLRLVLFVGLAGLYTLFAIVRSLFTRVREGEPGRKLPPEEAPALWALTAQVANRVGTRPLDAVYLTPGTDVAVTERGSSWRRLRGRESRSLILGLGVLPGMTQDQLRAILAHEYGHFSHRDTAGGDLARRALLSINRMAYALAASGQARWYNPAWLFVNGFVRVFLRVTLGASRLQEILADRYAAAAYGAKNLVSGLLHVIRQDLTFRLEVREEAKAALAERRTLHNLYALPHLATRELEAELEKAEEEVMARPTSPYDSHPAPRDRIALLERLPDSESIDDALEPAWQLLPNRQALQEEMTNQVRANLKRDER